MTFAVFQWFERTSLSVSINESLWAFAVVEAVHLLALAVIGGAVLAVDLRLLGFAFQKQRVADIARVMQPWLIWSLVGMLVTGFVLFISLAASKYYVHDYFWVKMYCLAAAIVFSFTSRHRVIMGDDARANSAFAKLVALVPPPSSVPQARLVRPRPAKRTLRHAAQVVSALRSLRARGSNVRVRHDEGDSDAVSCALAQHARDAGRRHDAQCALMGVDRCVTDV